MNRGKPWIPPAGLAAGQVAHGLSWLLLGALVMRGDLGGGIITLSWVHLVALSWLSMIALSVLTFVIPQFTDSTWRGKATARVGLLLFGAGAFAMAAGFWLPNWFVLRGAVIVVAVGLALYVVPAGLTLGSALRGDRTARAIARAFLVVFAFLAAATALGLGMAWAPSGSYVARYGAAVHAHLAALGWLTMLVMGVSVRTIGAIAGARPMQRWRHVAAGGLTTLGTVLLVAGLWWLSAATTWLGAAVAIAGIVVYAADIAGALRVATVAHRPPQAFLAASLAWLLVAAALGVGLLAGKSWGSAYVYVALAGWLGQMVNGHLHHIGVRLIATIARGDDDETQPAELLSAPLSWLTFALFQAAILLGGVGLLAQQGPLVSAAAVLGFAGWLAMIGNLAIAWRRASHAAVWPAEDEFLAVPGDSARNGVTAICGAEGFKALAGTELTPSAWLLLTQQRTDEFARVTGDTQWIHIDPVRAASSAFGGTVAHGFLTLSLIPYFWRSVARVEGFHLAVNYGLNEVRFLAPVPVPSRLRARFRIEEVSDVSGGIQARLRVTIEREGAVKPVCVAEMLVRHYL